jgi:hypothetical protein
MRAGVGDGLPVRIWRAESAGNPPNWFICRVGKIGMVTVRFSVVIWYMMAEGGGKACLFGSAELNRQEIPRMGYSKNWLSKYWLVRLMVY